MTIAGTRSKVPLWLATVALAASGLVACNNSEGGEARPADESAGASAGRPNIVWVLTDDLSSDLVNYMPHVKAMQKDGLSFSDYTVTDSLCCPSRSSIFTGKYPHNTGVFTNTPPDGGFQVFHDKGNEDKTFATALKRQGYRTAMLGKYLNGYQPDMTLDGEKNYVPPGWDEWDVAGAGYKEYDYTLNENGRTVDYGHDPKDYLTDVVSAKGQDFIEESVRDKKPFVLDISTFAPHGPATPAPQDEGKYKNLKLPEPPAFEHRRRPRGHRAPTGRPRRGDPHRRDRPRRRHPGTPLRLRRYQPALEPTRPLRRVGEAPDVRRRWIPRTGLAQGRDPLTTPPRDQAEAGEGGREDVTHRWLREPRPPGLARVAASDSAAAWEVPS